MFLNQHYSNFECSVVPFLFLLSSLDYYWFNLQINKNIAFIFLFKQFFKAGFKRSYFFFFYICD